MKKADISASHLTLTKFHVDVEQHQSLQEHQMRLLINKEILSVAGGPEVEVGTGTDLQRSGNGTP
ncbi:hypothetical protein ACO0K9_08915 [Undibacterium sp. Ji50W]|uniref:hypothetical protein n=1 Tax=Undibacterium sp. Ji50W TaxID=3413041 RepID=UPI003BF115C1